VSGQILLLSGPNLDLLGTRSPEIYGSMTLEEHIDAFRSRAQSAGYGVLDVQSNFEGDLIEAVQAARGTCVAIVINAAALTHTSWALTDALATYEGVKIEVHLSNPAAREPFRHTSTIAGMVNGTIAGFGALSYVLALDAVRHLLESP
jgi:3-dehydroquinate dehydratase II